MERYMSQKYEKLKNLLKELFQLDQPDLDFGLYRIMHARSSEISQFLDTDLLPQVKASFAAYQPADKAAIQKELDKVINAVKEADMDPEQSPKVKELRAKLANEAVDIGSLESEVYDHLYGFFRRYYSEGDFISKRVYKEGVYAIPYEGEEVKLHWANADQYYIKTSEYLRDYAFRLNPTNEAYPKRVHFRLADVAEGEHGNVKEAEGKNRVFVLAGESVPRGDAEGAEKEIGFISIENGELVIKFEYRPATLSDWPEDQRSGKTKPPAQKELIAIAEKRLLAVSDATLASWIVDLGKKHTKADGEAADYSKLTAHLNRYTARNTFDYFIHKDLGTFLNRELDFYIKNEVMHLDDVESETVPRVEQYLSKIKVIRKVAKKIINFLAQLEDFQKKLWLKKKFVVETNYCITLDRVPEEFYPEIAANKAQVEEWVKLGFLEEEELTTKNTKGTKRDEELATKNTKSTEKERDLFGKAIDGKLYASDISVEFLKANDKLVLDTKFFSDEFKARLIGGIENFDEQMDGILIKSENSQAMNLINNFIKGSVSNIFIDPPYNTGDDGFLYKDNYSSSSWLTLMKDRIEQGMATLSDTGVLFISIGDEEQEHLSTLLRYLYGKERFFATLVWEKKKKGTFLSGTIAKMKDYILCVSKEPELFNGLIGEINTETETYPCVNADNPRDVRIIKPGISSKFRESDYKLSKGSTISAGNMNLVLLSDLIIKNSVLQSELVIEGNWRYSQSSMEDYAKKKELYITQDLYLRRIVNTPRYKRMKDLLQRVGDAGESDFRAYDTKNLDRFGWGSNEDANEEIHQLLGEQYAASYPKPSKLLTLLLSSSRHESGYFFDYFAGSGTTGHAVINLNREDQGKRKFILVEMGDYFDTVLKPRIQKVIYSSDWRDGKPTTRDSGISHCFKYIRLESYEDTLNNLDLRRTDAQTSLLDFKGEGADKFKEDYILRYMLDVESRGSSSLLNIEAFTDPTAYSLKVKIPGSDESREVKVDLLETFNYLLGLQIKNISAPHTIAAEFERDSEKRLQIKGRIAEKSDGKWWFRTVTGTTLDGRKILVIWRKRPGQENPEGVEQDNLVLDTWFTKMGYSSKDSEFDTIYVNGTNNLENLKTPDDLWKVRLIEEDFKRLMFEDSGV
jgi:adenine-specific DNA-methyltransferase